MKNHFRRIFVLFLAAVLIFLLCGCDALDEMRHNQAYYDADGNILWNGSVYKKLPVCEYLVPPTDYETTVYVTEADVPVLLSGMLCLSEYYPSNDSVFLQDDNYEGYYCEESAFEQVRDRILAPFLPEIICYSYDVYEDGSFDFETKDYTLTQEQVDALTYVVENTEPTVMQEGMYLDCEWSVYLYACSQDMVFRNNTMDISGSGNTYYVHQYTDDGMLLFTVPEDYNTIFGQIVQAYLEAESAYLDEVFIEDEDI